MGRIAGFFPRTQFQIVYLQLHAPAALHPVQKAAQKDKRAGRGGEE